MPSRRTNNFHESGRDLDHVTAIIFGSTVGYSSDSLASCIITDNRQFQRKYGQRMPNYTARKWSRSLSLSLSCFYGLRFSRPYERSRSCYSVASACVFSVAYVLWLNGASESKS